MSAPFLVLGKDGLVGHALCALLGARAVGLSHSDCDLTGVGFLNTVDEAFTARPFSAVINAAAYTRVDAAEEEDSGNLLRVNAVAPGEIAKWCAKMGIPLVHFSTDYVFDGSGETPWKESDTPAPLSAYGMSKLAGERAIEAAGGKHLIVRTSWVYAERGNNFFMTMRKLMREREVLRVVDDQIGAPTYAGHLAAAVLEALEHALATAEFPSGVYHLAQGGSVSWCGFARAILAQEHAVMCKEIAAIASQEYVSKAVRPLNSRLDCSKARSVLGVVMPAWEDGLGACFAASRWPA